MRGCGEAGETCDGAGAGVDVTGATVARPSEMGAGDTAGAVVAAPPPELPCAFAGRVAGGASISTGGALLKRVAIAVPVDDTGRAKGPTS